MLSVSRIASAAATLGLLASWVCASTVVHASSFDLFLTTGAGSPLDLGFFGAGTPLHLTFTGNGDLTDVRYQVTPSGALFAPALSPYDFANAGEAYSTQDGGDGINHFAGGGANFDSSGSGYGFAGKQTTDTTDPDAIRLGAVVGTFSDTPVLSDWFFIGSGANLVTPTGGAHLYVAVNDTANGDNNGMYTGTITTQVVAATPEPGSVALLVGVGLSGATFLRRRRSARKPS